jgi:hypothetical protein
MRALAAAEEIASRVPELPTDIKVTSDCLGGCTVNVYFHHRPDRVAEFAEMFSASFKVSEHSPTDRRAYSYVDTTVCGVAVHAWCLDAAPAVAA